MKESNAPGGEGDEDDEMIGKQMTLATSVITPNKSTTVATTTPQIHILTESTPLVKRGKTTTITYYYTHDPYPPIYKPLSTPLPYTYHHEKEVLDRMIKQGLHVNSPINGKIKVTSLVKKGYDLLQKTPKIENNVEKRGKMNHSSNNQLSFHSSTLTKQAKYAINNDMKKNRGITSSSSSTLLKDKEDEDYVKKRQEIYERSPKTSKRNSGVNGSGGGGGGKIITTKKSAQEINTFKEIQCKLIHSLKLHDDIKTYINTCIVNGITQRKLRIPLTSFIKTDKFLENIVDLEKFQSRYQYVKYDEEHNKPITVDRLSVDWFHYDTEYQFISQMLIYLKELQVKYVLTKMPIELGLKSLYQDEIDYSTTTPPSSKEKEKHLAINSTSHKKDNNSSSSSSSSSLTFIHVMDYLSEMFPLKMKRFGYYYLLYVDLALTEPKRKDILVNSLDVSNK